MRFWITKNSELPVREQLVRQVLLGILSEDLPSGQRLPSVRAVARRHHIHSNTVSAAYHDLLEQGWLELRRGSGLYVRPLQPSAGDAQLDQLLAALLRAARRQNYEPEEVLHRLEHMLHPVPYEQILVAEAETAMCEILRAELAESLSVPIGLAELPLGPSRALIVALPTRAAKLRHQLPRGVPCITLRLRSVLASLEGQQMPPPDTVISIVSRSVEIRLWSRAMLIAVGLHPDSLSEVDASSHGWQDRLGHGTLAVADMVTARELPAGCQARVFRVIADSTIAELKRFCGC
jgi:DNA-binding transcriptional regulator YhcF (GntR family)